VLTKVGNNKLQSISCRYFHINNLHFSSRFYSDLQCFRW